MLANEISEEPPVQETKKIQQARLVTHGYQEIVPCIQLWKSAKSVVKWSSELDATTDVGQTEVRTGSVVL